MILNWAKLSKKELLKLPARDWELTTVYSSVLLVNTRTKHDSGYNLFAVVGVRNGEAIEICGYMDDFHLKNPQFIEGFSIDCSMPGVFNIWSRYYDIRVGQNVSSTDFDFVEKNNDTN
jgi:hypothetical protein